MVLLARPGPAPLGCGGICGEGGAIATSDEKFEGVGTVEGVVRLGGKVGRLDVFGSKGGKAAAGKGVDGMVDGRVGVTTDGSDGGGAAYMGGAGGMADARGTLIHS